jgi:hypothetical protein
MKEERMELIPRIQRRALRFEKKKKNSVRRLNVKKCRKDKIASKLAINLNL